MPTGPGSTETQATEATRISEVHGYKPGWTASSAALCYMLAQDHAWLFADVAQSLARHTCGPGILP